MKYLSPLVCFLGDVYKRQGEHRFKSFHGLLPLLSVAQGVCLAQIGLHQQTSALRPLPAFQQGIHLSLIHI